MHEPDEHSLMLADGPAPSSVPSPGAAFGEPLRQCLRTALGHELTNQFVALQGLIRMLEWEEADRLTDEGKGYLRRLAVAAERAHGLVHTLAGLLRPVGMNRSAVPVPFLEVARAAAAEVELMFAHRSIVYQFTGPGVLLPVPRPALQQVLVQLLRNAAQAGGPSENLCVEVGAREDEGDGTFWVIDQGRGLAPELRVQLDDFLAGRLAVLGRGFGLLFVRLVVESWGGRLQIASEPGQGCSVVVSLAPQGLVSEK